MYMKDSNKLFPETNDDFKVLEYADSNLTLSDPELEEDFYLALSESGDISSEEVQAFKDRQEASGKKNKTQEPKSVETVSSEGGGDELFSPENYGKQGHITSEARALDLAPYVFGETIIPPLPDNNGIKVNELALVLPVEPEPPEEVDPPVLPPEIVNILVPPVASPDQYAVKRYFANAAKETWRDVDFEQFTHGVLVDDQTNIHDNISISVDNTINGFDLGLIVDTKIPIANTGFLQPWTKGDIERETLDKVFTIAGDISDNDLNGIADLVKVQENARPGDQTGTITFKFTNPIYAFGFDIINADYPSISSSTIHFYDENGTKASLRMDSFIDPSSRYDDPTLSFGKNSANRIAPIEAINFNFNTFSKIELEVAGAFGIDNLHWLDLESHFVPGRISGNILDNDTPGTGSIRLQSMSYQDGLDIITVPIPASGESILTPTGGLLTINQLGQFRYTASNNTSLGNLQDKLNYTIINTANLTAQSTVTFDVTDNLPTVNSDECYITSSNLANNYNLMVIIDVSSTMNALITDKTRLQITREVIESLIERYDNISDNLNITIVPFASGPGLAGAFSYQALSAVDAVDYVMGTGAHLVDGLNIQMLNPNTNLPLDRGTHYDSALYHARVALERQVVDPAFEDYNYAVYFMSDGNPNPRHSAIDMGNWPSSWGSWKNFIMHTDAAVSGSYTDHIETFAIDIDPEESLVATLTTIVSRDSNIIEPQNKHLDDMSDKVLATIPNCLNAVLLQNDIYGLKSGLVKEITFEVENAGNYIVAHNLSIIGATSDANGTTVHVPIPIDNTIVSFSTPLGGKLAISATGQYTYAPPYSTETKFETFKYFSMDLGTLVEGSADLNIYIYPPSVPVHNLVGTSEGVNYLSSEHLTGIVNMWGQEGKDIFVVDPANTNLRLIHIQDLADNQDNTLRFIHTQDRNSDNVLTLNDIISGFSQSKENANVHIQMFGTSAELVLQNIGTVPGSYLTDLFQHLQETAIIEVL